MKITKQCFTCRKEKLWFLVKHRSFIFPVVSSLAIKSTDEMCGECFRKTKAGVFKGAEHLSDNIENNGQNTEGEAEHASIEG